MVSGERRQARWASVGLWLGVLAGCATPRPPLDQALLRSRPSPAVQAPPYCVACPDVLAVTLTGQAGWQRRPLPIQADGRLHLGNGIAVSVEGRTPAECAGRLADQLGLSPTQVTVEVVEYKSQKVYIVGEVSGLQRAVAYQGPETVVELLQRAGGLGAGADPNEVFVIRANVAEGTRPEVLPVHLRDIVQNNDPKTNLTLEPADQVYIGETRQSVVGRGVPPCLRPLYEQLCRWFGRAKARVQPQH